MGLFFEGAIRTASVESSVEKVQFPDRESPAFKSHPYVRLVTYSGCVSGYIGKSDMLPANFTRTIIRSLDWVAERVLPADPRPRHQRTGTRGEEDAYFYLRKTGYVMVARNFRSPRCRGEIDLIG